MLSALIILQFIIYYSNGQIIPTVLSSSAEGSTTAAATTSATIVEEFPAPITSTIFPVPISSTTDSDSEEFVSPLSSTTAITTTDSKEVVSDELPLLSAEECQALVEAYQNQEITSIQIDEFMETCELDCSFEYIGLADGSTSDSDSDSIETFEVPDDGCDCSLFECKTTTVNNGNTFGIKIGLAFIAVECLIMK